jgi:hypothetical protein
MAQRPCVSCPYRRDVPSGVWHPDEYAKLPAYDRPTAEQPTGVFICHQDPGDPRLCAGWVGCHGDESLALRLATALGKLTDVDAEAVFGYVSPVPLFGSGSEAAAHGMRGVVAPTPTAKQAINKLLRQRKARRR